MAKWIDDFGILLERIKCEGLRERATIEAAEQIAPFVDFVDWVASEVCQDDFEENAGVFAEVACRKLSKLGIITADGENWLYGEAEKDD